MAPIERDDWTDGPPTEVVPIEKSSDGRIERPDWTDSAAPATEAPAAESPAADSVAGEPGARDEDGKIVRDDWDGEETTEADAQPAPENAMHPADLVPDSIFADPETLAPELAPALDVAKAVLAEDATWAATIDGFTRDLTVAAQDVIVAEMAADTFDVDAPTLSAEQVEAFKSVPEAASLWQEWEAEGNALEKAAMARARLDRLILNLPEHEVGEFDRLMNALPPASYREVLRQLAGG